MTSTGFAHRIPKKHAALGSFALVGVAMLSAISAATAHGGTLPYHFDSLVFSADHIVEGAVVWPGPSAERCVRITFVHAGTLQVGQTIRPENLFSRRKPGTDIWGKHATPLQRGDRVILFLTAQASGLVCLDSGTFLAVRGRVFPFGKEWPMGTLTRMPERLRHDSPTISEFRRAVASELSHSAALHALLDLPAKPANAAGLLSLLASRAMPHHFFEEDRDALAEAAVDRLIELGDFGVAGQAAIADPAYRWRFGDVFSTRRARDYLIRRIADRFVPLVQRTELVPLLGGKAGFRRIYFDNNSAAPPLPEGAPGREPDDFVGWVRLAGVTAQENEALAGAVLQQMEQPLFWAAHDPLGAPQARDAAENARRELRNLYLNKTTPDSVKHWVECATAEIGKDAYDSLGSSSGPMLMLAEPPDPARFYVPNAATLLVNYDYRAVGDGGSGSRPTLPTITSVFLVLDPIGGGQTFVLPSAIVPSAIFSTEGHGADATPLPPAFPAGKYHVHYRLMDGDAVVSDGHGFDTLAPQPGIRVIRAFRPSAYQRFSDSWRHSWTVALAAVGALVLVLLVGRRLVRTRRRIVWFRAGRCRACGYDLRASIGRCPECGTASLSSLPTQVLRRRLICGLGAACCTIGALLVILAVRSHIIGDVVTRTDGFRADAAYTSRGVLAVQWLTIGSDDGWLYQRSDPADLPTTAADAGPPADWRALGIEYSGDGNMLIVPLWMPALLLALVGVTIWRARHPFLVPTPNPASKSTTGAAATSGAQSGSDPV